MARDHYVPAIDRFVVKVLFHEARHRGIPMTRLVDELLRAALKGSAGWNLARAEIAGTDQKADREAA